MTLSRSLEAIEGVVEATAMVASSGNTAMLQERGLWDAALDAATPSDVVLVVRGNSEAALQRAVEQAVEELEGVGSGSQQGSSGQEVRDSGPRTLAEALQSSAERPNLVMISVPGENATAEALKALNAGLHVFMFSDNVSVEDEAELKSIACERDLLLMGPDCGTSLLDGVPMGFCNRVRRGNIGLVGASGTGLQQVSSLVDSLGSGVSQMIGVGGRDLKDAVGGQMMLKALALLEKDANTETIVLVSKPPSDAVATKLLGAASASSKKVIVHFVGKMVQVPSSGRVKCAATLEDAARLAVGLDPVVDATQKISRPPKAVTRRISGLFSGGTFEAEAHTLLSSEPDVTVIDFGDDEYTRGKPHPMIDFSTRVAHILATVAADPNAVLLIDVVLGHGAHADPVGELVPTLETIARDYRNVIVVTHVCGTDADGLQNAEERLRRAGAIVAPSNAAACRIARDVAKGLKAPALAANRKASAGGASSSSAKSVVFGGIRALSVGVDSFTPAVREAGAPATHLQWRPPAGGSRAVGLMCAEMAPGSALGDFVAAANREALQKLQNASPMLIGAARAKDVIPFLGGNRKAITHAGPPIAWSKMCGPMRGAIIGACLFEGWAANEKEALALCDSGEVEFAPCHNHSAVGPMAGIIAPSFPVWVVENDGKHAFSSFNEGLGKVLRFGAFNADVINRLTWMRDTLGPSLERTLSGTKVDLFSIISRALAMGDECHNRNMAASSLLFRELAPSIVERDSKNAPSVLGFINKNDHFFLNLSMAACKAALDAAHGIQGSTLVTAMARNGVEFGARLSGTKDAWFTCPAPAVEGLYFPGYSPADANPDLGDSSITETLGIGGAAMAASPAIVGFVGGNAASSLRITRDMYRIYMSRHNRIPIPSLDFQGVPLGLDALKVMETNELPVINTGIAHREAGVGQIGAGICRAPAQVFSAGVHHVWSSVVPSRFPEKFALRALRAIRR